MELLPIIYVSLAIFAVVAVVTIITSFVSYKIRVKTEGYKKPYEKEEDPSAQNYMKKKIMDADGNFHTVISGDKNKENKKHKKQHDKSGKEKRRETQVSRSKTSSSGSRIKIVNQPTQLKLPHLPVKINKEELNEEVKKDLKSLNENILNNYTDGKEEEFFTMKVTSKKKEDKK